MKVAVLGDIHGNSSALREVLAKIRDLGLTKLLVTGDLVGYYYQPVEVLAALVGFDCEIVQGNHDGMLAEYSDWNSVMKYDYKQKYGSALERAAEELNDTQKRFLGALPWRKEVMIEGKNILLCHGSPRDRDEYVYPDEADDIFNELDELGKHDLVIMGHTHYPLRRGRFLNPGSVGQPRDGRLGASWAVLETSTMKVDFQLTPYDSTGVIAEAGRFDPEISYLSTVLTGRRETIESAK